MTNWFTSILVVIGIFLAILGTYWEYQMTVKYFPNMSFFEWVFLGDKIRITPEN